CLNHIQHVSLGNLRDWLAPPGPRVRPGQDASVFTLGGRPQASFSVFPQELLSASLEGVTALGLSFVLRLRPDLAWVRSCSCKAYYPAGLFARFSQREGRVLSQGHANKLSIQPRHHEPRPSAMIGKAYSEGRQAPVVILDLSRCGRLEALD